VTTLGRSNRKVTRRQLSKFLELRAEGLSITNAAKGAGFGRSTPYHHRDSDEKFAAAWREVEEALIDRAEQVMHRLATEGQVKPVVARGEVVGEYTEIDWRATAWWLERRRWREFGPPAQRVELSGQEGAPIRLEHHRGWSLSDAMELIYQRRREEALKSGKPLPAELALPGPKLVEMERWPTLEAEPVDEADGS
jgi:hypothetical protein